MVNDYKDERLESAWRSANKWNEVMDAFAQGRVTAVHVYEVSRKTSVNIGNKTIAVYGSPFELITAFPCNFNNETESQSYRDITLIIEGCSFAFDRTTTLGIYYDKIGEPEPIDRGISFEFDPNDMVYEGLRAASSPG